jgi:hypothetical protein
MLAYRLFVIVIAGAAFSTSAGRACAEEKVRTPDLSELKDAVARADKRGENVGVILEALAAFEKALGKSAIKAGETPPELTALREAVESAMKKSENVEAISKELGVIEKTLTGREYERPKPQESKPEAMPSFPGRRGGPAFGGNGGMGFGRGGLGAGGFNTTSMTIVNGNFTIRARQGDVSYLITGSTTGAEATKYTIQDGEKKIETDDLKKVPDEYRPAVEQLLKVVARWQ